MLKVQQVESSEKFNSQLPHLHAASSQLTTMSNGSTATTANSSSSASSSQHQQHVDENNNAKTATKNEPAITSDAAAEKNLSIIAQSPQANESKSNIEEKKRKLTLPLGPGSHLTSSSQGDISSTSSDTGITAAVATATSAAQASAVTSSTTLTNAIAATPLLTPSILNGLDASNAKRVKLSVTPSGNIVYLPNLNSLLSINGGETPALNKDILAQLDTSNTLTTPQIEKLIMELQQQSSTTSAGGGTGGTAQLKTPGSALALLTPSGTGFIDFNATAAAVVAANNNFGNSAVTSGATVLTLTDPTTTNAATTTTTASFNPAIATTPSFITLKSIQTPTLEDMNPNSISLRMIPHQHHQQQGDYAQQPQQQLNLNSSGLLTPSSLIAMQLSMDAAAAGNYGIAPQQQQQIPKYTNLTPVMSSANNSYIPGHQQVLQHQQQPNNDNMAVPYSNSQQQYAPTGNPTTITIITTPNKQQQQPARFNTKSATSTPNKPRSKSNSGTKQQQQQYSGMGMVNGLVVPPSQSSSRSASTRKDTGSVSSSSSSMDLRPVDMDKQEVFKLEKKRERNREAARKCRTRKLEKIAQLEEEVRLLTQTNEMERNRTKQLEMEIAMIRDKLAKHQKEHNCDLKLNI